MNEETLRHWIDSVNGKLYPPGTARDTLGSPRVKDELAFTVGLVHSHRFAFFFWSEFEQKFSASGPAANTSRPILVSIDSHNDCGTLGMLNTRQDELETLDRSRFTDVGLFCWLRLPRNNDGHILPALYLNFFSDALILLKQDSGGADITVCDTGGHNHQVKIFHQPRELIEQLAKSGSTPVYLDIDTDYFVSSDSSDVIGAGQLVSDDEIRDIISLKRPFMNTIFKKLAGLTIALEPRYCGGIKNSFKVLNILDEELFGGTLFTDECRWNYQ